MEEITHNSFGTSTLTQNFGTSILVLNNNQAILGKIMKYNGFYRMHVARLVSFEHLSQLGQYAETGKGTNCMLHELAKDVSVPDHAALLVIKCGIIWDGPESPEEVFNTKRVPGDKYYRPKQS